MDTAAVVGWSLLAFVLLLGLSLVPLSRRGLRRSGGGSIATLPRPVAPPPGEEAAAVEAPEAAAAEAPAAVREAPVALEKPAPTAGRLVRLRARLSRSQNALG